MALSPTEAGIQMMTARILYSVAKRATALTLGDSMDTAQRIADGIRSVLVRAAIK